MNENEFFYNLTPENILKAAELSGFEPTGHCMALNSYENRVYDLKLQNNSHIVMKFYRPERWSYDQIKEEHDFLFELNRDEIPVCAPLKLQNETSIDTIENIFFSVWPRTGGRAPDEFSHDDLLMIGRLLARIHNNGSVKNAQHRWTFSGDTFIRKPLRLLLDKFIPQELKKSYEDAALETARVVDEAISSMPFIRIHGDCHPGNFLKRDGHFHILDFDDFNNGPAVQDIWMLLGPPDSHGQRLRESFLEGYRTFREFDSTWLKAIEPLRALRYIHYSAWIAKRWEDPAFPQFFPHFSSPDFWEKETRDLQDQVEIFISEMNQSMGIVQEEEKEELNNKDFFWDWEE